VTQTSITTEQVREVAIAMDGGFWPFHECSLCNVPVGWVVDYRVGIHPSWFEILGVSESDAWVLSYDPSCGCSGRGCGGEVRHWGDLADAFNMQSKPEIAARMWEQFKKRELMTGEGDAGS